AELPRTIRIEGKIDVWPAVLVEPAFRVGQRGAFDQDLLVDEYRAAADALRRLHFLREVLQVPALAEDFRIRRNVVLRLLRRHRQVAQAELHLGGLADEIDQLLRIAQARHLHQHAVDALPLDGRLDQPEAVDALLDDRDRLLDRLPDALVGGRL